MSKLEYSGPSMSPIDYALLEQLRTRSIVGPPGWSPNAAAIIYLATQCCLPGLIYGTLPSVLDAGVRVDGYWPCEDYYIISDYLKVPEYDFLFANMPHVSFAHIAEGDFDKLRRKIEYDLHDETRKFYALLKEGPDKVCCQDYRVFSDVVSAIFSGGLAPAAIAMCFMCMKIKYIIESKPLKHCIAELNDNSRNIIENNILFRIPDNYGKLEEDLRNVFEGAYRCGRSNCRDDYALELIDRSYKSPVWTFLRVD
ncbi:hypothetical protein IJV57_05065 [Candidatus Saccharibacteria bacterium]|nr:hypothetical protein [Candidatus Saccharibacteria bacterium]